MLKLLRSSGTVYTAVVLQPRRITATAQGLSRAQAGPHYGLAAAQAAAEAHVRIVHGPFIAGLFALFY